MHHSRSSGSFSEVKIEILSFNLHVVWHSCCSLIKVLFFFCFNPEKLAKIKIEDDGSYVQLSEVNINYDTPDM